MGDRNGPSAVHDPPFSEPESYSATVIQTFEEGGRREAIETRMARSGPLFREEWQEAGELRAAIWRPDLGKVFLLSVGRRLYVETGIDSGPALGASTEDAGSAGRPLSFSSAAPDAIETRLAPDSLIDGHSCNVVEVRASFADGRVELTRTYRATGFGGLPLRIESETLHTSSPCKVLIERKNVETSVAETDFEIPRDYRKVASL